ncbi:choice-of-anchor D domain-containing protein [Hamadaea tsunoensis]|uniref:choice-of-anchor D domain-containing protein n=1 Tax=Hamadaea tsunoensis TaxID=53368 RepID=UPI000418D2F2|nr:choice-of-anchor D domain-containing protein [Hamadaea tsunoensis]
MRTLRRALLGAVAITLAVSGGVFATSLSANAAEPITGVTYEGSQLTSGSSALRSAAEYGAADTSVVLSGEDLTFTGTSGADPGRALTVHVAPSLIDPKWTVKQYNSGTLDAVYYITFTLVKDGSACAIQNGWLDVKEVVRDASGALTAFAASYAASGCGGYAEQVDGELRYNSSLGYVATDYSASSIDFGSIGVGAGIGDGYTAPQTVTYTARGTAPTQFGAATVFSGSGFEITADTCSNTTVQAGQSCTLSVRARAAQFGVNSDRVQLANNNGRGATYLNLTVFGVNNHTTAASPTSMDFGTVPVGTRTATKTFTITVTGLNPLTFVAANISGSVIESPAFVIVSDTCAGKTLGKDQTCTVGVAAQPNAVGVATVALQVHTTEQAMAWAPLTVTGQDVGAGMYAPVPPARLLDTRSGLGAPKAAVGPQGVVPLLVRGRGGVPAAASAVVLNVTVTAPTAAGFVSVYPSGGTRPTVSSLNFPQGWTGANSVTVSLGSDGKVNLYNNSGSVQLIADVVGYYLGSAESGKPAGEYQPVEPVRLLDSREPGAGGRVAAGGAYQVPADFGTDNTHVRAWAVNVTAVSPTKAGFFTTWSGTGTPPTASTLNYTQGQTVSNFAIVPSAPCTVCTGSAHGLPSIGVYSSASAYVIVDILGYYDDGVAGDGLRFRPMTPVRIADTRAGSGFTTPRPGTGITVGVSPPYEVIAQAPDALAYAMNITAIAPTRNTYLTVYPSDLPRPAVSNVNANAGAIVPNAAITVIGPYDFYVYNLAGDTNFCVDVSGAFYSQSRLDVTAVRAGITATQPDPVRPKTLSAHQPNPVLH